MNLPKKKKKKQLPEFLNHVAFSIYIWEEGQFYYNVLLDF